jgi:hypothetical protein
MLKATHRVQRCMALGDKNSKAAFGGRDILETYKRLYQWIEHYATSNRKTVMQR